MIWYTRGFCGGHTDPPEDPDHDRDCDCEECKPEQCHICGDNLREDDGLDAIELTIERTCNDCVREVMNIRWTEQNWEHVEIAEGAD